METRSLTELQARYDSLLAVLRRLVDAMPINDSRGDGEFWFPINTVEIIPALLAARAVLEEEKP